MKNENKNLAIVAILLVITHLSGWGFMVTGILNLLWLLVKDYTLMAWSIPMWFLVVWIMGGIVLIVKVANYEE